MHERPLGPPYGPPTNLTAVLEAWRERGMPARITKEWLARIGLSENLAARNLHGLRFLRLVDDRDEPTEIAEKLRLASSDAYPAILAAVLRTAYAKVWALVDPLTATRERIDDAFRHESPAAQRSRMVACFLGLCAEAALLPPTPGARVAGSRVGRPHRTRTLALATPAPEPPHESDTFARLFAKFPDFDPAWPDDLKGKWFDAFARLHDELRRSPS